MVAKKFYDVVNEAIADLAEHGYDSAERVSAWEEKIRRAAEESMTPPHVMEQMLRDTLATLYKRMIDKGQYARYHPGIDRFTLERVKPHLRAELDRRIMASANLIRLNREEAIQKTLRRFSGWSTSIPKGGSDAADAREAKEDVRKSLAQLPFVERRVLIDQGHKLTASINDVLARDGNAIAAVWNSNFRQAGYDFREEHRDFDGKVFAIRGNWALEQGLMKVGKAGYTDDIEQPAEKPFCRCWYSYLYNLSSLPKEMLTKKGGTALTEARKHISEMA